MRFSVITDIHFGPPSYHRGVHRKLTHFAPELTQAFVQQMNTVYQPACVLQLGDLIEDQDVQTDRANLEQAHAILSGLDAPIYHALGNHDLWRLDLSAVSDILCSANPYYSFDLAGVHFVCLWSEPVAPQVLQAHIGEAQLVWLERDLATANAPVVVFTHYALADQDLSGNAWFANAPQDCLLQNREAVRHILAQSGKVVGVFNGHLHWNHLQMHDGIPYITVQSVTENFHEDGVPAATYALCELDSTGLTVTVVGNDAEHYFFVKNI